MPSGITNEAVYKMEDQLQGASQTGACQGLREELLKCLRESDCVRKVFFNCSMAMNE